MEVYKGPSDLKLNIVNDISLLQRMHDLPNSGLEFRAT